MEGRVKLIEEITLLVSIITVLIGGIFSLVQWKKNSEIRRAQFIHSLLDKLYSDKYNCKAVYILDSGKSWHTGKSFDPPKLEKPIDSVLYWFDYICYLKEEKIITDKEFAFFEYDIERLINDKSFNRYMKYFVKRKIDVPFVYLYGMQQKRKVEKTDEK